MPATGGGSSVWVSERLAAGSFVHDLIAFGEIFGMAVL
jgi:hypothetical protein